MLSNSEWSYPKESTNSNARISLVDMLIKVKIVADCFHVLKAFRERFSQKECYRFLSERKQEYLIMHFQTFSNFLMVFLNNAKAPQGPMFETKLNLNNEMYSACGRCGKRPREGGAGWMGYNCENVISNYFCIGQASKHLHSPKY